MLCMLRFWTHVRNIWLWTYGACACRVPEEDIVVWWCLYGVYNIGICEWEGNVCGDGDKRHLTGPHISSMSLSLSEMDWRGS
ncbi:hypothetical protein VNO77_20309 [Canavalia gladiata]|uniref:Uncharacterized protein n=1 Tax=Canavalia gladiata TaxID=3824 RepID=A0AAN9LPD0_CANGL